MLRTEVFKMLRLVFCVVLFGAVMTGAAFANEVVDGTVKRSDGMYEYTKITVVDTFTDDFFTYWVGNVKGYQGRFFYDSFNRVWVPGPISYQRTAMPFGGTSAEGWVRLYGDGSFDERFFFGVNGHVYQRIDQYRRRRMAGGRKRKRLYYQFWVDLYTGARGDVLLELQGLSLPSEDEVDSLAEAAKANSAFPAWEEAEEAPPEISEEPLTEEEKLSLGAAMREAAEDDDGEKEE